VKQDILLLSVTSVVFVMDYRCSVEEGKESLVVQCRDFLAFWMDTVDSVHCVHLEHWKHVLDSNIRDVLDGLSTSFLISHILIFLKSVVFRQTLNFGFPSQKGN
jgi:hypothetical protein